MGVAFSSLWSSLFGTKELKICILGLDNAGKTTLTYQMTMGQAVATAPTVGSNTEHFTFKNLKFTLWDVGGQASLRASWTQYLAHTDAVVFVFDSTDRERVQLAREELHKVASDEVSKQRASRSGAELSGLLAALHQIPHRIPIMLTRYILTTANTKGTHPPLCQQAGCGWVHDPSGHLRGLGADEPSAAELAYPGMLGFDRKGSHRRPRLARRKPRCQRISRRETP